MTKKNLWLGILALTLVFTMTVVGCSDGSTDNKGNNNGNNGNNGNSDNGNNDNSGGGTFTLTGIPAEYNGKYAVLIGYEKTEEEDEEDGLEILGFETVNLSTEICTYPVISNGSVSIPLWIPTGSNVTRYSGNHTFEEVGVGITSDQSFLFDGDIIDEKSETWIGFYNVTFSNGSATRAWSQGSVQTYNVKNAWKWGEGIEFTVSGDTITVNVTKNTDMDSCGIQFSYNVEKNKTYRYSFEAWTKSGTRNVRVCFGEDTSSHYPNKQITITPTKQTYNLDYLIGENWISYILDFNCGGDIGELYIRIISIEPLP